MVLKLLKSLRIAYSNIAYPGRKLEEEHKHTGIQLNGIQLQAQIYIYVYMCIDIYYCGYIKFLNFYFFIASLKPGIVFLRKRKNLNEKLLFSKRTGIKCIQINLKIFLISTFTLASVHTHSHTVTHRHAHTRTRTHRVMCKSFI